MSGKNGPATMDEDNREWTSEDFAEARPPEEALPAEIPAQFRRRHGPQKAPKKALVSISLSTEVLEHFKATGPGWQSRVDETLKAAIRAGHAGR